MRTEAALAVLLAASAFGAPPSKPAGPPPAELAQLYFLAGDLPSAQQTCSRVAQVDARCRALIKPLAEYAFLAGTRDSFTPAQAREYLALDARLSPKARSKLTEPTWQRFVQEPLARAKAWAQQGHAAEAVPVVEGVLLVVPAHAEAQALLQTLRAPTDAGTSRR